MPLPRAWGSPAVLMSMLCYTTFSSLAIVANKVVLSYVRLPGLVFCLQIVVSLAFILCARAVKLVEADGLTAGNVRVFLPYTASFVLSLYSNGRALAVSNIETVIVFRACSPLCVSLLDWLFLGRELPSRRSFVALLGVVVGAVAYVLVDSQFALHGVSAYGWVTANLCGIIFEMTYGKQLISGIKFASPVWGAVFYTNALALLPMAVAAFSTGEARRLRPSMFTSSSISWLAASCVVGVGISWSGWNCRAKIAATTYTLLGVVCKFISVLLNVLIWDKHATPAGLMALFVCLSCSSMYQQAPLRMGDTWEATERGGVPPDARWCGAAESEKELTALPRRSAA